MSSKIAIKVENLSKCYQIYDKPHDRLKQFAFPRLQQVIGQQPKQYFKEFWALKDVSFEVKKGETVGIIGRNGSGKSTLLQMICGTLNPTNGTIQTQGRIAALLELGSGFNPEFTGRENVYMNAAVLGLQADEIDSQFDDIAAFADIGNFIEQPVKTYSSGMMVRLAFSVSINVRPDILVVDEALAVGDGAFQLKCMTRLKALQDEGATILFVSHDLGSVGRLCSSVCILDRGALLPAESVFDSIRTYDRLLKLTETKELLYGAAMSKAERHHLKSIYNESEYLSQSLGTQEAIISEVQIVGGRRKSENIFFSGDKVSVSIRIISDIVSESVILGFGLRSPQGVRVIGGNNKFSNVPISLSRGVNDIEVEFFLNIVAGEYFLNIGLVKDDEQRTDLDQRWGVRKLTVASPLLQVGQAYTPIEFRVL